MILAAMDIVPDRRVCRFHEKCGSNIMLLEGNTTAERVSYFDNGVVFSEEFLKPGQIFLVELIQVNDLWSGGLRMGLTTCDPCSLRTIPRSLIPDMLIPNLTVGQTWGSTLYNDRENEGLGFRREYSTEGKRVNWPAFLDDDSNASIVVDDVSVNTSYGKYLKMAMKNAIDTEKSFDNSPGDKVGIVYVPTTEEHSAMFQILNGEIYGPFSLNISHTTGKLRAVVDVYGTVKRVRILQIQPDMSLQSILREFIRRQFGVNTVSSFPLPKLLRDFLQYKIGTPPPPLEDDKLESQKDKHT